MRAPERQKDQKEPAAAVPAPATRAATLPDPAAEPEAQPRTLRRCFDDSPPWADASVAKLLDRARDLLEQAEPLGALACAEEAARQAPRSVEAHYDRGMALVRLERFDEARDAAALALAIAPADPDTLELAADLYLNHLPPSADRTTLALEYARRGLRHDGRRDPERSARLALIEGQALIDLGRAAEALRPIGAALRLRPLAPAARYERALALFELCRFDEARTALKAVLDVEPGHAHALYHLGLVHEREGDDTSASTLLAEASRRDPKSFPPPAEASAAEFAARVRRIEAALPPDTRSDLQGIQIETAEFPSTEDLTAELPPLSPTILGLFRGTPLGRAEAAAFPARGRSRSARAPAASANGNPATYVAPERAIVLYRRNILRSVASLGDLDRAIRRTLLHEIGHLHGEDDGSLRDRGLE